MNISAIPPLISSVSFITLGLFVFLKNPRSLQNQTFGLMCLVTFWWQFCWFILFLFNTEELAKIMVHIGYTGIIFIPYTFYHFFVVFLKKYNEKVIVRYVYLFGLIFVILNWASGLFIKGYYKYPWGYYPKAGLLHPIYLLSLFGTAGRIMYLLYRELLETKSSPSRYNQNKYILCAFIIYTFASLDFAVNYGFAIYPIGFIFIIISLGIMAYTIVKYHLLDINIALTRAGIFTIVYAIVLGIPFWLGYRTKSWFPATGLAIILASAGPFIFLFFQRRAENIILKDQRRYQEILRKLSATLTLIKDLERLLKLVVLRVARAVKVDFACVYLANENGLIQKYPYTIRGFFPDFPKELSFDSSLVRYIITKRKPVFAEGIVSLADGFNLKAGLIIPSFIMDRLLGFLLLGPKSSGIIYTQEDANIFGVLANQLALAIENTNFIEESQKTQAQLFATEQMASLGTMAGGMTHQINNRFHAISLATSDTIDTLNLFNVEGASKEEIMATFNQIKHALERIQENSRHGGKIVNDFLNFSQPERMQKEAKEFDLREPLKKAIEMARIKTAFPEEVIAVQANDTLFVMQGNFVLLQDAFFNLINNAIDALDKKDKAIKNKELPEPDTDYRGRIAISISKKDSQIIAEISDNGIGMTDEQMKKIFVPFFTTKATSVKGTGLGLFVIKKIIEAHEGIITVESEYGKGSTFIIKLPQAKKENNA